MHPYNDDDELWTSTAEMAQSSVTKLNTICLMQMSHFMLEPTAAQAERICTLLHAIRSHKDHYRPGIGCDPYLQAQSIWIRVAQHIRATYPASEPATNDCYWLDSQ